MLVLAALAVLLGLGFWQLERLEWKEALIEAATARPNDPAVPAPGPMAWPLDMGEWNYRRVALTGRYTDGEILAWTTLSEPRGPLGGMGYFILTPFVTNDGFTVLVNRGFVPDALGEPSVRHEAAPPEGPVTVEGIVRRDDPPNFVTPEPDRTDGIWFSRHIATMAQHLNVTGPVAPYNVDLVANETPPGGLPQAGESQVTFSNNHLQYAVTWFGLALCLIGVVTVALVRRGR